MEPIRDPERTEIGYLDRMAELAGARVLEIGCGDGRLTWRYAEGARSVAAIEPDWERLAPAIEAWPEPYHRKVQFLLAEGGFVPFADESFDTAVFAWSL